jgi:uncharacterized protein (TIGR03083 family)
MNPPTDVELQAAVANEFLTLADLLDRLGDEAWDTPSLCTGWRVREVVAHMTMAVRYSMDQIWVELRECDGDFTRLSNRVAGRDAALPAHALVGNLRDERMHQWTPPGGGHMSALNHVVIHGLDITVPLGIRRDSPDEALRIVLDDLTRGGTHAHFGFDLDGLSLRATDMDWSFGSGAPIGGAAGDLVLLICGRELPAGRIQGELPSRTRRQV